MRVLLCLQMFERLSTASGIGHQETHVCFCGLPSPLQTSWSKDNPSRRYFGWLKFKDGSGTCCKFFYWVDDSNNDHTRMMLSELKTKNKLLENQLYYKEAIESRLYFSLIVLCGLCLALASMLMYFIFGIPQGIDRRRLPL
jgi:hypothetical protein